MHPQTPRRRRLRTGMALLGIGCIAAALHLTGIGCPIKFITGVSCPGCGMTRAWLAALSGNIRQAVAYHPLFWLVPVAAALALFGRHLRKGLFHGLMALCIGALLLTWLLRLGVPNDTNMVFSDVPAGDVVSYETPPWLAWLTRWPLAAWTQLP